MIFRTIAESIEVVDVPVGAHTIKVRQLSGLETEMLSRIKPRPVPPLKNDPDRGSLAPMIPNPDDAQYKAACEAWATEHIGAVVAVALGGEQLGIAESWPEVTVATHARLATRQAAEAFIVAAMPIVLGARWSDVAVLYEAALGRRADNIEAAVKN